jgi:hypothetical protein
MEWVEFVKLQAPGAKEKEVTQELGTFSKSLGNPSGLVAVKMFYHASVHGDFAILLLWDTDQLLTQGSPVALGLIEDLKKFGLVDYSAWVLNEGYRFLAGI